MTACGVRVEANRAPETANGLYWIMRVEVTVDISPYRKSPWFETVERFRPREESAYSRYSRPATAGRLSLAQRFSAGSGCLTIRGPGRTGQGAAGLKPGSRSSTTAYTRDSAARSLPRAGLWAIMAAALRALTFGEQQRHWGTTMKIVNCHTAISLVHPAPS
jgi:hypothetical protein